MIKKYLKHPFVREFFWFGSSYFAYQGSLFITYLITAKIVGPKLYGLWSILLIILSYATSSHLGILNAINREIPYSKGSGDIKRAEQLKRLGFASALTAGLVAFLVLIIISFLFSDHLFRNLLRVSAFFLFFQEIFLYFQIYLQSDRRFFEAGIQQFIAAFLIPAFVLPLLFLRCSLYGLILGQLLAIVISLFVIARLIRFPFRPDFELKKTIPLIKIGLPIMLVGLAFSFLTSIDRWVIFKFLSPDDLGFYSLAATIFGAVMLLPLIVSTLIHPRMAERYGKTKKYSFLIPLLVRGIFISLAILLPVILALFFIFPYGVIHFMPQYLPAIAPMKILLPGLLFLPLTYIFGSFFININKQIYYLMILFFAILLNLYLSISFVKIGLGISGVALGATITYITYILIIGGMVWWFNERCNNTNQ
jgi:O-antigen/teichoic acid export membrane protein